MKLLIPLVFLMYPTIIQAQITDTLLYERFETGGTSFTLNTPDQNGVSAAVGYNQWIINNAYAGGNGQMICLGLPTTFTVPPTPAQPAGITGGANTNYMHIISDVGQSLGILNCSYLAANGFCGDDEYNFTRMSNDINTMGYDSVTLSFLWACAGGASIYGELYYSINSGNSWNLVTLPISQYVNQSNWTTQSITLPTFAGQQNLRFGFRFVNEISVTANDPGFAIDEFLVTGKTFQLPVAAFGISDSSICETGCVDFTDLSTGNPTSWFWIFQGSTTSFSTVQNPVGICYNTPGNYDVTLIIENSSGSDTLTLPGIVVNSNPAPPVITASGDTLFATPGFTTYEWMVDGIPIPGASDDFYIATANGEYTVTVTDSNGCSAQSAMFLVNTGINESGHTTFKISPNPTTGIINFDTGLNDYQLLIMDVTGRIIERKKPFDLIRKQVDLSYLQAGYYWLLVVTNDGRFNTSPLIKL